MGDEMKRQHEGLASGGWEKLSLCEQMANIGSEVSRALNWRKKGNPLTEPDFMLPIGGVGKMFLIPGFQVDSLTVPTLSGFNLVYKNPRIGVKDIKFFDEEKGQVAVLDGVFGSNFLCASAKMDNLLPSDVSKTIFDKIVLDLQNATVGFDIYDNYTNPKRN